MPLSSIDWKAPCRCSKMLPCVQLQHQTHEDLRPASWSVAFPIRRFTTFNDGVGRKIDHHNKSRISNKMRHYPSTIGLVARTTKGKIRALVPKSTVQMWDKTYSNTNVGEQCNVRLELYTWVWCAVISGKRKSWVFNFSSFTFHQSHRSRYEHCYWRVSFVKKKKKMLISGITLLLCCAFLCAKKFTTAC